MYLEPRFNHPSYPLFTNIHEASNVANQYLSLMVSKSHPGKQILTFGTGTSGMVLGTLLLTKNADVVYCHIRKPDENSHGGTWSHSYRNGMYELIREQPTVWIIDDLVSSGRTIINILKGMEDIVNENQRANFIINGILAYASEKPIDKILAASKFPIEAWYH